MKFLQVLILLFLFGCSSSNKIVIAHRGAPGYLPEHTLEGTAMAHSWNVDYIEPDIVLTKDSKAVILHDIHIDTTTNVREVFQSRKRKDGRYYAIDFTLRELKKLKLNERVDHKTQTRVFDGRFPHNKSNFEIPTLKEFIELVQGLNKSTGKNVGIYPELKSPEFHDKENKDIAKVVIEILRDYGYDRENSNAIIQCFYPPTLKRLRNYFKTKIPLVLLIAENSWQESSVDYELIRTEAGIKEVSTYANGIGPYFNHLVVIKNDKVKKSHLVQWAHKYGLVVHPYTHRSDSLPKFIKSDQEFFDFLYNVVEVDGIFSDFADRAMKFSK